MTGPTRGTGLLADFRDLKQKVSIEQVLDHRGLLAGLRVRTHVLVGPCPIHGGDNPWAFVVHRSMQLWRCWTHCRGGDVIDLVRRLDHVGHAQAGRTLLSYVSAPVPLLPPIPSLPEPDFRPFLAELHLDPEAQFLRDKGILPGTAREHEVGAWHGRGMLDGCIAVRLRDPGGAPLGYAGRRIDPARVQAQGKWVFPPRFPAREILFGWPIARSRLRRGLAVVECPWGVLRLDQAGVPAVALLGTNVSPVQQELLARAPRLFLLLDGDPAGRQAARRIHAMRIAPTSIVDLPAGRDPDDLSDDALRALLHPHLLS
jgi:DNA primase